VLESFRQDYRDGKVGNSCLGAARAVVQMLKKYGVSDIGTEMVRKWLRNDD
jgi:hypothetical protein